MINEGDLEIYDSTIGFNVGQQYSIEITRLNKNDLEKIRDDILINQKIKDSVLELWLNMLNDGIGGMPTKEESIIFSKLTGILPKKLRDEKLEGLK